MIEILYFSHGGGPLPVLNDPSHEAMNNFMESLPAKITRPAGIIVFSAHWEEDVVTIQNGESPEMIYDYYGFPKAAYEIKYPCKGNPYLAAKVANFLSINGISCILDDKRPYDHGVYIPLKMMYPEADIPVIQVSLNHNLDPEIHFNIGKALRALTDENILIIGSGFSFHNMRKFDFEGRNLRDPLNDSFQDSLSNMCCGDYDEEKIYAKMANWHEMPDARYCHPREEHLVPLFVCLGAAKGQGVKIFDDYILGKRATAFFWR